MTETLATTKKPWVSRWVRTASGIKTHYIEAGDGPPVVLLHGAGPGASGAHGWPNMIPALAPYYRTIALDQLGWGETEKPSGLLYSHQDQVEHLKSFLDVLCIDRVRLVGNSWGGYVAAKFALDYPERVEQAFIVASATIAEAMGLHHDKTSDAFKSLGAYDGTFEGLKRFLEAIVERAVPDALVADRLRLAKLPGAEEARLANRAYMQRLPNDPDLWQRFQLKDRLPRLTIPIRMVWGGRDRFAPADMARQLAPLVPNMPIEVLESAGHQAQNDSPEEVNARVLAFFAEGNAAPDSAG